MRSQITAAFSHSVPLHFAFNMVAFNSFAPILIELLAVRQFLSFYLSASAVASLSHAAYCLATRTDTPALGASGAVSSMMVMVAILFPSAKFLIFGIFPCPAIVCVAGFATYEIFYLGDNSGVGRAAHLGGLAFGVLYYFRRIRIRL
uniref:Peptidase S54 rhomboid domain-containing protein n=1 Tax=Spongospora subterranea TaxID=70186 RepID=A0A0H5QID9_9EUKA|eukprot:CRZ01815.1 hypothetical protein [Spongospora subterranea]